MRRDDDMSDGDLRQNPKGGEEKGEDLESRGWVAMTWLSSFDSYLWLSRI